MRGRLARGDITVIVGVIYPFFIAFIVDLCVMFNRQRGKCT